jgi:mRNA-degrading endonuclease RelE of RelBE toxin-antitoxin system
MAFRITITVEAESQLRSFSVREQRFIETAIQVRLSHQPTALTKAVKRLRPNPLCEFQLRVGDLRVLYNVEGDEVVVVLVGHKVGNTLMVKGQDFHGHKSNPSESPPG